MTSHSLRLFIEPPYMATSLELKALGFGLLPPDIIRASRFTASALQNMYIVPCRYCRYQLMLRNSLEAYIPPLRPCAAKAALVGSELR